MISRSPFNVSFGRNLRKDGTFLTAIRGSIGTLIAIKERPDYLYVHGSLTAKPNPKQLWPYLVSFLQSVGITAAFVRVHTGGKGTICSDFEVFGETSGLSGYA
jgi:hypothetical protein